MANIKKVRTSEGDAGLHEVEALHFIVGSLDTPEQWKSYIDSLVGEGLKIVVDAKHATKEEPATTASASTVGKLYLVPLTGQKSGSYTEFVTVETGTTTKTYTWEKIGTTDADLTDYLKKNATYTNAALSNGAHTHSVSGTVTVPVITKTAKKIKATATQGTVDTSSKKNALGANATFRNNVTTSNTNVKATASGTAVGADGTATVLTGVKSNGSDTFVKAAIKSASLDIAAATETGRQQIVTEVGATTLTGTKTFVTGVTPASLTNNTGYVKTINGGSFTPSVDTNGVLSFSFVGASVGSTGNIGITGGSSSGTGTVGISSGTVTHGYAKIATEAADSKGSAITGVSADGTATALTGVKVTAQPTVALSTGATAGTGVVSLATGIGTHTVTVNSADTVSALTDVSVGNPTVTLSEDANGDVDVVDVTVGTANAPINAGAIAESAGAHTHDVKVTG